MPVKFNTGSRHFGEEFHRYLAMRERASDDVRSAVSSIIGRVREDGDSALIALTQQFDWPEALTERLRVAPEDIARAVALTPPEVMKSLKVSAARIRAYNERQLPMDAFYTDEAGVQLGWK